MITTQPGWGGLPTPWPLRVLALWQPWASLCVLPSPNSGHPFKRWETRHWQPRAQHRTHWPIPVVIHATASWKPEGTDIFRHPSIRPLLTALGIEHQRDLPLGAIVGLAFIVRVDPAETVAHRADFTAVDRLLGNYEPGRYAFELNYAAALPEPIPYKARQEVLYRLDDGNAMRRIMDQVGAMREGHLVMKQPASVDDAHWTGTGIAP